MFFLGKHSQEMIEVNAWSSQVIRGGVKGGDGARNVEFMTCYAHSVNCVKI